MHIQVSQRDYAMGPTRIYVGAERRAQPYLPATVDEQPALRAGAGKVAWLVRNTRPDLAFWLAAMQQGINSATIQTVLDHNTLIGAAKKNAGLEITYVSLPLEQIVVIGWCDAMQFLQCLERTSEGERLLPGVAGRVRPGLHDPGGRQERRRAAFGGRLALA